MILRALRWKPARRPGNFIVWSLLAVTSLLMVLASFQLHLRERMTHSTGSSAVALGRLQALYLAEMGVNHAMFRANLQADQPFSLPDSTPLDFTAAIAMTRDAPGSAASCELHVVPGGDPPYEARASLRTPESTFTQVVAFDVGRVAEAPPGQPAQWVLRRYVIRN